MTDGFEATGFELTSGIVFPPWYAGVFFQLFLCSRFSSGGSCYRRTLDGFPILTFNRPGGKYKPSAMPDWQSPG